MTFRSWSRVGISLCMVAGALCPARGAVESSAVRMHVVDGRPVVDSVFVNGHGPFRFLIDTGTTANHIEPALARRIGLVASFRTRLSSSVGEVLVPGMDGAVVALGGLAENNQSFVFAGMDTVHELSFGIQGVLGQAFLSRIDYRLDLRAKVFRIGGEAAAGGTRLKFRTITGRPVVTTSLGEMVIDSGAACVTLFGSGLGAGVKAGDGMPRMMTMTGAVAVGMIPQSLKISGRTIWRGLAAAITAATPDVEGLLPVSLFRAVYVSNSGGYVDLE